MRLFRLWLCLVCLQYTRIDGDEALSEMMASVAEEVAEEAAAAREEALDASRAEAVERESYGEEKRPAHTSVPLSERKNEKPELKRKRPPKLIGKKTKSESEKTKHEQPKDEKTEHTVPADLKELYEMIADGEAAAAEAARKKEYQLRSRYGLGSLEDADRRLRAYEALSPRERRTLDAAVTRVLRTKSQGHYAVLGVRRSCPPSAIKRAYRAKALLVHPDRNPHPSTPEAFDALTLAHETLANPSTRRQYDRRLQKKALIRRAKLGRAISSLFDTAREYITFRSKEYPFSFFASAFLAFALIV